MADQISNELFRPIRAGILVPRLDEYDAIGNDTICIFNLLRKSGYEVSIFTDGSKLNKKQRKNLRIVSFERISDYLHLPGDLLIYQYAIAWDPVFPILNKAVCRKILRFHNVTPPEFFAPYNASISNACKAGLDQIPDYLKLGWNGILADSEFNKRVLVEYGADPDSVTVVPPFHRISELLTVKPSIHFIKKYVSRRTLMHSIAERITKRLPLLRRLPFISVFFRTGYLTHNTLLMVGRLVPSKGYEDLLRIFSIYKKKYDSDARLLIVGRRTKGIGNYYKHLKSMIKQLGLKDSVDFAGPLNESQLKAAYLSSRVFITASLHEGFCIPVLEAMAIGLPVIARNDTALSDTVGVGGILIDPPVNTGNYSDDKFSIELYYNLFADAVHSMISDEQRAMDQIRRGCRYFYERFSDEEIQKQFMKYINNIEIKFYIQSSVAE